MSIYVCYMYIVQQALCQFTFLNTDSLSILIFYSRHCVTSRFIQEYKIQFQTGIEGVLGFNNLGGSPLEQWGALKVLEYHISFIHGHKPFLFRLQIVSKRNLKPAISAWLQNVTTRGETKWQLAKPAPNYNRQFYNKSSN